MCDWLYLFIVMGVLEQKFSRYHFFLIHNIALLDNAISLSIIITSAFVLTSYLQLEMKVNINCVPSSHFNVCFQFTCLSL